MSHGLCSPVVYFGGEVGEVCRNNGTVSNAAAPLAQPVVRPGHALNFSGSCKYMEYVFTSPSGIGGTSTHVCGRLATVLKKEHTHVHGMCYPLSVWPFELCPTLGPFLELLALVRCPLRALAMSSGITFRSRLRKQLYGRQSGVCRSRCCDNSPSKMDLWETIRGVQIQMLRQLPIEDAYVGDNRGCADPDVATTPHQRWICGGQLSSLGNLTGLH
jgi:hypothetical protein